MDSSGPLIQPVAKGGKVMKTRRSDHQVARTVKALAARLGLEVASLGGHSLRSGFLTSAAARGTHLQAGRSVAAQEHGHAAGYVRDADIFKRHVGEGLL